jgi:hypothetical protein
MGSYTTVTGVTPVNSPAYDGTQPTSTDVVLNQSDVQYLAYSGDNSVDTSWWTKGDWAYLQQLKSEIGIASVYESYSYWAMFEPSLRSQPQTAADGLSSSFSLFFSFGGGGGAQVVVQSRKLASVIRISPYDDGTADTNSVYYSRAITTLRTQFIAQDVIEHLGQIGFGTAASLDALKTLLNSAAKANARVVFVLHGSISDNDKKNAFGQIKSPATLMDEWNKLVGGNYLTPATCAFISCDEDVKGRTPYWQTENRIAPYLLQYFQPNR